MTWSYDPTQLAANQVMRLRLEIQDTDETDQLLQDEEITYLATQERNFWSIAARCCEVIHRNLVKKADTALGRALSVKYTIMAKQYGEMTELLRRKALGTQVPWVGGMSEADKQLYQENSDLIQPAFARNMMTNPRTGGYSSDIADETTGDDAAV